MTKRLKSNAKCSIYLDARKSSLKKSGLYPTKLRVWCSLTKKAQLYQTNIDVDKTLFNTYWNTNRKSNLFESHKEALQEILSRAISVKNELEVFSFSQFEKKLFRKAGDGISVLWQFNVAMRKKAASDSISTGDSYKSSLNSFKLFLGSKNKTIDKLTFFDITPDWLSDYETYVTVENDGSLTTVGIYLRNLRTLFNTAIRDGEISRDFYPFGSSEGKYKIPSVIKRKSSLNRVQLKTFLEAKPKNKQQERAKDFWFFTFACSGINIKDILLLTPKNFDKDESRILFFRAKTIKTKRQKLQEISFYLNDFALGIIKKYGQLEDDSDLIFDVLSVKEDVKEQQRKIKNFTRFISQHIKIIAEDNGLPKNISCSWARHSFATNSVQNGASMELMKELLGHSDTKTTEHYFDGFDSDTKKDFAKNTMNF